MARQEREPALFAMATAYVEVNEPADARAALGHGPGEHWFACWAGASANRGPIRLQTLGKPA